MFETRLEEDRKNLITDLENGGIKNLVKQMANDTPYSALIKERQLVEVSYSSEDNISWHAYKVSQSLSDQTLKEELLSLLNDKEFLSYRKYIFCCLASLSSNINDYDLFEFLLEQLEDENDESIIVSVFSRLDKIRKPKTIDISIIKKSLLKETENIRKAAIKALSNSEDETVEDLLLDEFKVSDKHIKGLICYPLQTVGTKKSIGVLQAAYKKTKEPFLRLSIEDTISEINRRTQSKVTSLSSPDQ